jgi:hypothetical protein
MQERANKCKSGMQVSARRIFLLAAIFAFIFQSGSLAFELSPANPAAGEEVTITGRAEPEEDLTFQSSFTMYLPVTGGEYGYETAVLVPQKPNRFSVSAKNVQDFNAGVKLGIWITKSFQASDGTIRLSQADVPPGRYSLKMFGRALPGSSMVPVTVQAETRVQADAAGNYELAIDTSGIPAGEYMIQGAGDAKTIRLGDSGSAPAPALVGSQGSNNEGADHEAALPEMEAAKPVGINRDTVQWYAAQMGLEIKNTSQYDQTESLLQKRLQGGYWKIIARGEPLTEQAGDCLEEYCLVRGLDACRVCREKDILLKGGQLTRDSSASKSGISAASGNQSSSSAPMPAEGKGITSMIGDWIGGLLAKLFGGL